VAEITLTKAMNGTLVPATNYDKETIDSIKVGQTIKVRAVRVSDRSLQHHKLFFGGLLGLVLDYWEPDDGLVTKAERETTTRFARWLDSQSSLPGTIEGCAEAFLDDLTAKRADKIPAPNKSIGNLLTWIKIEAKHYDIIYTPSGMMVKPKSISFERMSQEEFQEFYKKAFNVCWRYVLSRTFKTEEEAQAAITNLVELG